MPLSHQQWLTYSRNCNLLSKGILENYSNYIWSGREKFSGIFNELQDFKFKKSPIYYANFIRFELLLHHILLLIYCSLLKQFKLPVLSLFRYVTHGNLGTFHTTWAFSNIISTLKNLKNLFSENRWKPVMMMNCGKR